MKKLILTLDVVVCLKNRSANVRGYCFFSLGAEFGLCLSFVMHFVHDVVGRFSLVESLILDNWNVNSGVSYFWLKICVYFQRDKYYVVAIIYCVFCF